MAVGGRVAAPAATATGALQALLDGIESRKPPLMEVVAGRDATVAALLGDLAFEALVGAGGCCAWGDAALLAGGGALLGMLYCLGWPQCAVLGPRKARPCWTTRP